MSADPPAPEKPERDVPGVTAHGTTTRERRLVVSLVVIGNEVLSGKVEEMNARFLIKRLRALGARVREVVFIEDDVLAIAEAVARVAAHSDTVITSGGVGPTHDDVTVAGVAQALGVPVVEDEGILALLSTHLAKVPGARRLARAPEGAVLMRGKRIPWPVIRCQKVWLFPGVPVMLEGLFEDLSSHFAGSPEMYSLALELIVEESRIVEVLDALVARHPAVEIGSYPRREDGAWRLRLTFDGSSEQAVLAAHTEAGHLFASLSEG